MLMQPTRVHGKRPADLHAPGHGSLQPLRAGDLIGADLGGQRAAVGVAAGGAVVVERRLDAVHVQSLAYPAPGIVVWGRLRKDREAGLGRSPRTGNRTPSSPH